MVQSIEAAIAIGELIDKITILEIKVERFTDSGKTKNAALELNVLVTLRDRAIPASPELDVLTARLKSANERIWDLENAIRECERQEDFGPEFVAVARKIYRTNDERAAVKREINLALGSELIEEKSYQPY